MPDNLFFFLNLQILRDHLQASGNVLDAAIRAYKDYLADRSTESSSSVTYAPSDNGANDAVPIQGMQHLHMFQPKMFSLQCNHYIRHS